MRILQLKGCVILQIMQDNMWGVFTELIPELRAIVFFWKWDMIFL